MSVINQMLRDLEKRRNSATQARDMLAGLTSSQLPRKVFAIRSLWLIIGMIMALMVGLLIIKFVDPHKWSAVTSKSQHLTTQAMSTSTPMIQAQSQISGVVPNGQNKASGSELAEPKQAVIKKIYHEADISSYAEQQYSQALQQIKEHHELTAIQLLQHLIAKDSHFMPAQIELAKIDIKRGELNQAQQIILSGLHQQPDNVELIKLHAQLFYRQQHYQAALNVLETVNSEVVDDPAYYELLAAVYQHLQQPLKAASIYQQLLNYDQQQGTWWLGLAISLEAAHQNNRALQAYQQALESQHITPALRAYMLQRITALRG
ncbi:MAG: tetratricopeptide repeat protein [Gammaproteobacteria bacterium]